jgi:hypothetical protein
MRDHRPVLRSLTRRPAAAGTLPWLGLFVVAAVWLAGLIRPIATGPIAFDAASSVLYFNRILAGVRLEAFVNTTPKPLLTVLYGLAYGLSGDWRAVSLVAIAAGALAVVLGARLAWRVAGISGLVVAVIALAGHPGLIVEVSWGHGLPWAVTCWLAAGLALTANRPRYALGGVALLLGGLARPETFLLLGVATAGLGILAARGRLPAGGGWLLLGWLAIPVLCGHDALLTGDPLYWLRVASIYATGITVRGPGTVASQIAQSVTQHPVIALAAIVGVLSLARTVAGRIVAIGLLTVGGGTAALLIVLAARGYATLGYYRDPIMVALVLAAAFGVAAASRAAIDALARRLAGSRAGAAGTLPAGPGTDGWGAAPGGRQAAASPDTGDGGWRGAVLLGGATLGLALLVLAPLLLSRTTLDALRVQRQVALDADQARATIARLVRERGVVPGPAGDPHLAPPAAGYRVLVSRPVQTRLAVMLGLPITVVGPLTPDHPTPGMIHPDLIVFRERFAERSGAIQKQFTGTDPITVEGIRFVPVEADPRHGRWIWASDDP